MLNEQPQQSKVLGDDDPEKRNNESPRKGSQKISSTPIVVILPFSKHLTALPGEILQQWRYMENELYILPQSPHQVASVGEIDTII